MRFPIPDNLTWSPDDLTCFRVMWPDTVEWRAILAGLLYLAANGRNWNEDTGAILDVIAVGRMLAYENIPVRQCDAQQEPIDEKTVSEYLMGIVGGDGGESEEFMWSVTDMTIDEQGRMILHYGPCCQKIVGSIPQAASQAPGGSEGGEPLIDPETGEPIDNIWELLPPESRPTTFYQCGAADGAITKLYDVVSSMIDHQNEFDAVAQVRAEHMDVSLDVVRLALAQGQLATIYVFDAPDPILPDDVDILWEADAILSAARWQRMRCLLRPLMPTDGSRPSRDNMASWMTNIIRGSYPLFVANFITLIAQAIGWGDLADKAQLGATNALANCTCPDLSTPTDLPFTTPTSGGWYMSPVVWEQVVNHGSGLGWVENGPVDFEAPHDVYGIGFYIDNKVSGSFVVRKGDGLGNTTFYVNDSSAIITNQGVWHFGCDGAVLSQMLTERGGFAGVITSPVFAAMTYAGVWQSNPATPNYLAGYIGGWSLDSNFNEACNATLKARLLYNINSPSHSA